MKIIYSTAGMFPQIRPMIVAPPLLDAVMKQWNQRGVGDSLHGHLTQDPGISDEHMSGP